jgi:trans-aconitate 2-methyltransferase
MTWSPKQYLAFEDERTRPVRDLVGAIGVGDVSLSLDIGCGPGNSTEVLAARFPGARIQGFDNSPEMIVAARERLPDVEFKLADVEDWAFADADIDAGAPRPEIILANAVLQWVPGHETLLPAIARRLGPRGALAIQMPDNLDQPSHVWMRETAADGPWRESLREAAAARTTLPGADWYYALLRPLFAKVEIWRTTYYHPLAGAGAIVEWVKGTGLRPFLDPLGPDDRAAYLQAYRQRLEAAYPALADGVVLLPFPRLFILAER